MLYQASDISPDVLGGTGCVDAGEPLTVSWRLGGTTPLGAWQADIYENLDLVFSTGKVLLRKPVYPLDPSGTPRYFSVELGTNGNTKKTDAASKKTNADSNKKNCPPQYSGEEGFPIRVGGVPLSPAAADQNPPLLNGHEYRLLITQWDTNDLMTVQATPSVFLTRTAPSLTLTAPTVCTSRTALVTAAYAQPEGDAIAQMRWTAEVDGSPVRDSGTILGAAEPKLTLDGLLPDTECTVTLEVKTEAGASASASVTFPVEYSLSPRQGEVTALSRDGLGCILVGWTRFIGAASYSVLRREGDAGTLEKVADCPANVGELRDYAVLSGRTYTYYVFPSGPCAYLTLPLVSAPVRADLTAFRLIEGEEGEDGVFTPVEVHLFTCSDGDPMPGGISNNNAPSLRPGLSRYPIRLPSPSNYKSGILSGYVGDFNGVSGEVMKAGKCKEKKSLPKAIERGTLWVQPGVNDMPVACQSRRVTEPQRERGYPDFHAAAFKNLPFSSCVLLTPFGERYRIFTSGPIIEQTNYKTPKMPVSVRVPWVETGPAPTAVTTLIDTGFLPVDGVIVSAFTIDTETGQLTETTDFTPHTAARCTLLTVTAEGILAATEPTEAPAAILSVDEDYHLLAEADPSADPRIS